MIAHHFLIASPSGTQLMGHALLCPAARYASIRWREAERLDRRVVAPDAWPRIVVELKDGWTKGLVPPKTPTYDALVDRQNIGPLQLQKLTEMPFANDVDATRLMDGYLLAQLFEARRDQQ